MWLHLTEDIANEFALREGCLDTAYLAGATVVDPDQERRSAVERVRSWKKRNAERSKAADRARYVAHAAERKARARTYYAVHKDEINKRRRTR